MISFIPDWCHFRYCSLTYNLLSDKNSLFCNRLYIIKKASYHGKKIKQKNNNNNYNQKNTFKVCQRYSSSQLLFNSVFRFEWYGDRSLYGVNNETHETNWNQFCNITFLFNLLAKSIFSFTSGQSYLTLTDDLRVGFEGDNLPLKMDVWLKVLAQPMRNLQAHQRL